MYFVANKRGFTLIELLVVIAIIGVLASVVLASLNSARAKARDAKRVADLKQINLAIQLYIDTFGSIRFMPNGTTQTVSGYTSCSANTTYTSGSLEVALESQNFFADIPKDPLHINDCSGSTGGVSPGYHTYMFFRGGVNGGTIGPTGDYYCIYANLENPTPAQTATMKYYDSNLQPQNYGMDYAICGS